MWTRLTTILDRSGDAIVAKTQYTNPQCTVNPPASCANTYTISPFASERAVHSRGESNLRASWSGVRTAAGARARAESEREKKRGEPASRGSKNARLRAQPLCLFRRVVARRCGGGRSEPRGGHQGSASGPWRSSGKLHPLSRPLNPRAVRLVRVRLPRSTVRPSIYSNVHSFVCSAYCSLSHRIFRCIVSYRLLPTAVANESDACKWYLHGFPLFLPPELLAVPTPDYRRSTAVFHPRGKRRSQRRVLLDVRLRDLPFWIFRDRFSGWWIVLVRGQRESFLHMVSTLWT